MTRETLLEILFASIYSILVCRSQVPDFLFTDYPMRMYIDYLYIALHQFEAWFAESNRVFMFVINQALVVPEHSAPHLQLNL